MPQPGPQRPTNSVSEMHLVPLCTVLSPGFAFRVCVPTVPWYRSQRFTLSCVEQPGRTRSPRPASSKIKGGSRRERRALTCCKNPHMQVSTCHHTCKRPTSVVHDTRFTCMMQVCESLRLPSGAGERGATSYTLSLAKGLWRFGVNKTKNETHGHCSLSETDTC